MAQGFRTNLAKHKVGKGDGNQTYFEKAYNSSLPVRKGDEVAFFKLGSTVVLIFESPELAWRITAGQKVRMGQTIGTLADTKGDTAAGGGLN